MRRWRNLRRAPRLTARLLEPQKARSMGRSMRSLARVSAALAVVVLGAACTLFELPSRDEIVGDGGCQIFDLDAGIHCFYNNARPDFYCSYYEDPTSDSCEAASKAPKSGTCPSQMIMNLVGCCVANRMCAAECYYGDRPDACRPDNSWVPAPPGL